MVTTELDDETAEQLALLADATGLTRDQLVAVAVARLVADPRADRIRTPRPADPATGDR